ncbi:S-methyl-5'-thioadenosine phosphorylase [Candidatus Bipolaricaulota bacterium]|nr:S-methyl-5'-thioadenosine phosphorylase [Candidatus Bipolaricaulota bacterium]
MSPAKVAVIGGSGLYRLGLLEGARPVEVHTPYGPHSPGLMLGEISGHVVAFLPRHGLGHRIPPHKVPYRANIWALRELGAERIVALSAMGGLRPDYRIGDLVLPDQFIDWTKGRPSTFFDGPKVVHTSLADPFCPELREVLAQAAQEAGFRVHKTGTALTFEGPRFSTRAESRMFREILGADLLSMTQVPEVVLARELSICYATCAVVTDLDVWGTEPVRADEVTQVMREAEPKLAQLLTWAIPEIPEARGCDCAEAAREALGEGKEERK